MLLEEFDEDKTAIFNPSCCRQKIENLPNTCVSFFSKTIMKIFLKNFDNEIVATISNATTLFPVYKINFEGTDLLVYQSAVGAPACISNYEELIALGIKNMLLVGCCGCLDKNIEEYEFIIPTAAIRDEGTSYHYEKASDETLLDKNMIAIIEDVFIKKGITYRKGKTWTTDAIFRETRKKANDRIKSGAITVEMECSAMNVVSKYRKINFGQFFYGLDNLGGEAYNPRSFINNHEQLTWAEYILNLGLKCGIMIDKKMK